MFIRSFRNLLHCSVFLLKTYPPDDSALPTPRSLPNEATLAEIPIHHPTIVHGAAVPKIKFKLKLLIKVSRKLKIANGVALRGLTRRKGSKILFQLNSGPPQVAF